MAGRLAQMLLSDFNYSQFLENRERIFGLRFSISKELKLPKPSIYLFEHFHQFNRFHMEISGDVLVISPACPYNAGRPDCQRSNQINGNLDVSPGGFGIRTRLVRGVHQRLGDFGCQARQADVEAGLKQVAVISSAEVDFGINGQVRGEIHLHFRGDNLYGACETGRPTNGEQLLRVGAVTGGARNR